MMFFLYGISSWMMFFFDVELGKKGVNWGHHFSASCGHHNWPSAASCWITGRFWGSLANLALVSLINDAYRSESGLQFWCGFRCFSFFGNCMDQKLRCGRNLHKHKALLWGLFWHTTLTIHHLWIICRSCYTIFSHIFPRETTYVQNPKPPSPARIMITAPGPGTGRRSKRSQSLGPQWVPRWNWWNWLMIWFPSLYKCSSFFRVLLRLLFQVDDYDDFGYCVKLCKSAIGLIESLFWKPPGKSVLKLLCLPCWSCLDITSWPR